MANRATTPSTDLKRNANNNIAVTKNPITNSSFSVKSSTSSASLSTIGECEDGGLTGSALLELCSTATATALVSKEDEKEKEKAKTVLPPTPPKTTSPEVVTGERVASEEEVVVVEDDVVVASEDEASTKAKDIPHTRCSGTLRGDVPEFVPKQPTAATHDPYSVSIPASSLTQHHSQPWAYSPECTTTTTTPRSIHGARQQPAQFYAPRTANRFGLAPEQEWLTEFHEKRERMLAAKQERELAEAREDVARISREMAEWVLKKDEEGEEEEDDDDGKPKPLGLEGWLLATLSEEDIRDATFCMVGVEPALVPESRYVRRPLWRCEPVSLDERFRIFHCAASNAFPEVVDPFPAYVPLSPSGAGDGFDGWPSEEEIMYELMARIGGTDGDDDNESIVSNPWEGMGLDKTPWAREVEDEEPTRIGGTDPINGKSSAMAQRRHERESTQQQVPESMREFLRANAARAEVSSSSGPQHPATPVPSRQTPKAVPTGPSKTPRQQQHRHSSNNLSSGRTPMGPSQSRATKDNKAAASYGSVQVVPPRIATLTDSSKTTKRLLPTGRKTDRMRNRNWRRGS